MDKIEEYIKKIIRKANDTQAYYTFGFEHRSTYEKPIYMINIVWTKQGLVPLRLTAYTKDEIITELKKYFRSTNPNTLLIRYHENQIEASKGVIKHHTQMIDAYKNPPKEEKSEDTHSEK